MSEILVLMVDDEPQVRLLVREVLARQGVGVVEARDSAGALSLLQTLSGTVGLVIGDYRMPGMNGATLARQVKEQFPTVPVLMVSSAAYASECAVADGFLAKPFAPDDLVEAVRRLARPAGAVPGGR